MVTKGWDLDNVRLVGVVNADTSLHFPDYRSGEVTFSLLTQVAGRTGRGNHEARVIFQTYSPQHYAIGHALTHDYLGFAREEIRFRKLMNFPPYSRMVTCTYGHRKDESALAEVTRAAEQLRAQLAELEGGSQVEVLGPSAAFVHRLRGVFRWQLLIRAQTVEPVLPLLPRNRGWSIDVDPAA
jgi:primosomal protein N' (replication factor Y)